jgi:carbon monoxide dehydrogenase subunit G
VKVERTIDIAAPPDEVYETVMDPRRLDEWVTIHVSVDDAPEGPLERGSEMRQCLKLAGSRFHVDWKVVKDERPSRVVWEGKGPVRSKARVVYDIEPNGDGTRFCYMNEFVLPGGPLGRLAGGGMRGIAARESERSLERLKKLLER